MKLYYFETSNPRKACAVARYLNSPVEFVRVDLSKGEHQTPEFLALNPNGKVPVLVDGDRCLWESNAIMAYLSDKAGFDLWPKDERQIEVLRWLSWDMMHFSRHAGTLFFENVIKARFGLGERDPAAVEEAMGFFRRFASVLDSHLKGRRYLVGDGLTIADFSVGALLPEADAAGLPLDDFAEVRRWYAQLEQLPAWQEPFPSQAASAA